MGFADVTELAARQQGLFTRRQARIHGIDAQRLRRLARQGVVIPVCNQVLRVVGSAPGPYERPMMAVLDTGHDAIVSHLSAARLWGVPNLKASPVHVTVSRQHRALAACHAVIHLMGKLPKDLQAVHHDVPVAAPALVVLQVAGTTPWRAPHILDTLWSKGVLRIAEVQDVHDRFSRQGRNGIRLVRKLLKTRSDDMKPAESGNERRFEEIMLDGDITTLERQVDLGGASWIGRVDFRDVIVPLVVEIHSEAYHTSYTARQADAARIAALEEAGFTVVVVWDHEIWGQPNVVLERVRAARARLLMEQRTR